MSLFWKIQDLAERIKHRKTLTKCKRCRILYKKVLASCPECSDINDKELDYLLEEKSSKIENMGKAMFSFIAIFFILMLLIYGAIYFFNT